MPKRVDHPEDWYYTMGGGPSWEPRRSEVSTETRFNTFNCLPKIILRCVFFVVHAGILNYLLIGG
jgi:hypothetical protein